MFVKTLPLRTQITGSETFAQLIKSVREDLLQLDAHQNMPPNIYDNLRLDVLFVLQPLSFNYEHIELAPGLTLNLSQVPSRYHRLPLLVNFIENTEGLRCDITFDASKYAKEEIEILVMKYEKLLAQLTSNTNIAIRDIEIELTLQNAQTIDIEFSF
jgi:surfactin family lipopeptide synthetase A